MPLSPARVLRQFRYALYFDGVDDYVLVPNNPLFSGLNTITVMMFVNCLGRPEVNQAPFTKHRNAPGYREWMIYAFTGRFVWQVFDDTAVKFSEVFSSYVMQRFVHLAGVYDNGYQALYVDSSLVASKTVDIVVRATTEPLNIGRRGDARHYFQGYIYHVMLYTRALGAGEIRWNYSNPDNPIRDGLVLWLQAHPDYVKDIDRDGVPEWLDLSGFNNHGKIYGATLVKLIRDPVR
jgi:hypothetical protein